MDLLIKQYLIDNGYNENDPNYHNLLDLLKGLLKKTTKCNYAICHHRNGHLYWINLSNLSEAAKVAKDLDGQVFEGNVLLDKDIRELLKVSARQLTLRSNLLISKRKL